MRATLAFHGLIVSEIKFKIKAMLSWKLPKILSTSAIIYKQRLLRENEIVQYLQNYECQDVNQSAYKFLQMPCKMTTLRYPIHFSQDTQCLATFNV